MAIENAGARVSRTAAEHFWYILGCISFGSAYLRKVPVKKALQEVGSARMTAAEKFWYVLGCIAFGSAYFAKVPVKKALNEVGASKLTAAEGFWYVLGCIAFGSAYFAKMPVKKALYETGNVQSRSAAERFWYVLGWLTFGQAYFVKVSIKKALSEGISPEQPELARVTTERLAVTEPASADALRDSPEPTASEPAEDLKESRTDNS